MLLVHTGNTQRQNSSRFASAQCMRMCRGGRIFSNRIQSNDYFAVMGVTDYRSQKVIVTKYPDPFVRPDAAAAQISREYPRSC